MDTHCLLGGSREANPSTSVGRQTPRALRLLSPYQGAETPQPLAVLLNHLWFNSVVIKNFLSYYTLIFIVFYQVKCYNSLNNKFFILTREVF